jgi:hypothetical protein
MRRLKLILSGFGLFFSLLLASWFGGRKSGKTSAKIKAAEAKAEAWEDRNEVENRIARERDARERLRQDWSE